MITDENEGVVNLGSDLTDIDASSILKPQKLKKKKHQKSILFDNQA